jgi:hypothetical protein
VRFCLSAQAPIRGPRAKLSTRGVKICCSVFLLSLVSELESVQRLASAVDEVIRELASAKAKDADGPSNISSLASASA